MTRSRPAALAAALPVLIALTGGVAPLTGQGAVPEPALIELRLGRMVSRTTEGFRVGDDALIPLSVFFEMAELRTARRESGVMEAVVQPGNRPFVVEPASGTLRIGDRRLELRANQYLATDQETYLGTAVLQAALGPAWVVDWADLQVTMLDPSSLPVARRLRRESTLRARLAGGGLSPADHRLGLERTRVDGVIFDYALFTPFEGVKGSAYSTALGLDALGGSLALGLQSRNGVSRPPRADASWTGVWRENALLTQLRLGDGFATGPRSRTLRGASLTNSPYLRPAVLGQIPFAGDLGAGWTVEAYRGGRLIGFDSVNALGRFSFDVPIQYGENPVDFVAYGPFGEVRAFSRTYRAEPGGLPGGRLEYGLSAGECRTPQCRANGNLDLRYGVTPRMTIRAGVDRYWRDSLPSLSHPYAGILAGLTNSVVVEGEAVGDAVLRGAVRYEPSVNLLLSAEAHRFARGVQAPLLTPEGRLDQWTLNAFWRPPTRLGATYLEASLDRVRSVSGILTSGRLGASAQAAEIRFLPSIRFQHQASLAGPSLRQTFLGLNTFVLPHPSLGPVLGSLTGRTALEIETGVGPSSASAFLGLPILRGLRAETGATWRRGMPGAMLSLLIAAELPGIRSYTTVSGGGGMPATGSQYTSGSAVYNPSRGAVDFTAIPSLQRGGLTGRVFLDVNGNGRFDAGEQPLAGVRVIAGAVASTSDSTGTYQAWNVVPFEPVTVQLDSTSLPSPLWVPAFAAVEVEPAPNRYRTVDIPVLPGGEIEGAIRWKEDGAGGRVAGVVLMLRHLATGERRTLTTFSDGGFYAIGLRPGEWELTVDETCLDALEAQAEPLHFHLVPDAERTSVGDLEVHSSLVPSGEPEAAGSSRSGLSLVLGPRRLLANASR